MRIVVFAYACEPGHGSEPGAGWMWARLLSRLGETWVVTRANNRPPIEAELSGILERDRLHFVWVDLPERARRWKRGGRGLRLYYLLWQVAALREARRLHGDLQFDLAWHVTLSTVWLGSLGGLVGPPFAYGPLGGGANPPWSLLTSLGPQGIAYELVRGVVRGAARYLNPMARAAWRGACVILTQNEDTRRWLPRRHRARAVVLPHVIFELDRGAAAKAGRGTPGVDGAEKVAVFAGRLLSWKGGSLAIKAIRQLPGWALLIAGDGPDAKRLARLVRRFGMEERVRFLGHLSRDDLLEVMREQANVFLFPSLHDEAGWVVVEASACGLPVVCLEVGGPSVLGGRAVPASTPARTARRLALAVLEADGAAPAPTAEFSIDHRLAIVRSLLAGAGLPVPASSPTTARG
jgi:glycosyltransferase involved in cell wall biosynthesis